MKKNYALVESNSNTDQLQKSKTQKRFIFLFSVILMISIFLFSDVLAQDSSTDNWTLHSEMYGVKVYYQFAECESESIVLLKFENTNTYKVLISWNTLLTENNNIHFSETATPLGVFITNCNNSPEFQLTTKPGDNKPISAIEALKLFNIQISAQ